MKTLLVLPILSVLLLSGCTSTVHVPWDSWGNWAQNTPKDYAGIKSQEQLQEYEQYKIRKECRQRYNLKCFLEGRYSD